jgi:hypothetical protein
MRDHATAEARDRGPRVSSSWFLMKSRADDTEGETMKWSLWRLVLALTIAVALVLAAHHLGWSHIPMTVE